MTPSTYFIRKPFLLLMNAACSGCMRCRPLCADLHQVGMLMSLKTSAFRFD